MRHLIIIGSCWFLIGIAALCLTTYCALHQPWHTYYGLTISWLAFSFVAALIGYAVLKNSRLGRYLCFILTILLMLFAMLFIVSGRSHLAGIIACSAALAFSAYSLFHLVKT